MANKARGEMDLILGGERYTMRPSFEAIAEIEDLTGKGLLALAIKLGEGNGTTKEMAAVIYSGLKGAGSKLSFEEVGEKVIRAGITKLSAPMGEFLRLALQGSDEEESDSEKK
jgi:hypothetical protein